MKFHEGLLSGCVYVGMTGTFAVSVRWTSEIWPLEFLTLPTELRFHVDLPVNVNPNEGWKQWRLVDDIVLRNTLRQ